LVKAYNENSASRISHNYHTFYFLFFLLFFLLLTEMKVLPGDTYSTSIVTSFFYSSLLSVFNVKSIVFLGAVDGVDGRLSVGMTGFAAASSGFFSST